jgi:hypothetical protein
MTQITAASPATAPGAIVAMPGQAPLRGRDGPLRNGNPRGDPNLAPRCGAKARSGLACRAPAMANGRCRNHGGKCTGPRTPEGLASLARAHTTHGDYGAAERATYRYRRTLIIRSRVLTAAEWLRAYLPPELQARLALGSEELSAPPRPFEGPVATPGTPGTPGTSARGQAPEDKNPCNACHRALVPVVGRSAQGRDARGRALRCKGRRRSARPRGWNGRCWRRGGRGSRGRGSPSGRRGARRAESTSCEPCQRALVPVVRRCGPSGRMPGWGRSPACIAARRPAKRRGPANANKIS